jgi:hypothetical protein
MSKIKSLANAIDRYFDTLSYTKLHNMSVNDIHQLIFEHLSKIVLGYYDYVDMTQSFELSISSNNKSGIQKSINITGYIKVNTNPQDPKSIYWLSIEAPYYLKEGESDG